MTLWTIYQDTDFCSNVWEERLYNAVVGVIYCFCFFNLKEGISRYRATVFYSIIIVENFAFIVIFQLRAEATQYTFTLAGFAIVGIGTIVGLTAMMLYYRFYHPAGPINLCAVSKGEDDVEDKPTTSYNADPDFEINDGDKESSIPPSRPPRRGRCRIQYSRSFKDSCPLSHRYTPKTPLSMPETSDDPSVKQTMDSAYGTASNSRTNSRNTVSPDSDQVSSSSPAYNNETYMSVDEDEKQRQQPRRPNDSFSSRSEFSQCSQTSAESRITVIERVVAKTPTTTASKLNPPEKLLKRSPILKDVTKPIETKGNLAGPLTIIIPNISHQAFARLSTSEVSTPKLSDKTIDPEDVLPSKHKKTKCLDKVSVHDYENLALVNINRVTKQGVISHWRTYSDMANAGHDESTAYERKKSKDYSNYGSLQYYDIYPLSKEMKDQLYRSITPASSTAATMASDTGTLVSDSDTYEPIETFSAPSTTSSSNLPMTLIHHDGQRMMTRQIESLDNLKEILHKHEHVPMDDPQDRGDLYLLAPMRLLTPIIEEPEDVSKHADTTYQGIQNRSILTVISEMLGGHLKPSTHPAATAAVEYNEVESSSTLVHTIDEIRNSSLCNLFFSSALSSSNFDEDELEKSKCIPAPQVPPRNNVPPPASLSPKPELLEKASSKKMVTLSATTSAGSRKNILELASGSTNVILNTPKRPPHPPQHSSTPSQPESSSLHPTPSISRLSIPLSPSSKYDFSLTDNCTPTPPQFVRNINRRPMARRKFSTLRDKTEEMYQNVSDRDLLTCDISQISKSVSTPSFVDSKDFCELRPDEKYENLIRGGWATSSIRAKGENTENVLRNAPNRRSMSAAVEAAIAASRNKENVVPQNPLPLGPKPASSRSLLTRSAMAPLNAGALRLPSPNKRNKYQVKSNPVQSSSNSNIFASAQNPVGSFRHYNK